MMDMEKVMEMLKRAETPTRKRTPMIRAYHRATKTPTEFPKVMRHEYGEDIVIFTKDGVGTVLVTTNTHYNVGDHRTDFIMDGFKPYHGTITIEVK